MKTFIIAAVTADGFIARSGNELVSWTSKADKKFFRERTKQSGVIVMGSTTYSTIGKPLPDRRNIILSRTKTSADFPGAEVSSETPAELVARLIKEGVSELAVCGGSHIYSSFMKTGLVDNLYLTIEPIVFGQGVPLFSETVETKLELVQTISIGEGSVVLEYNVIR
jgi:dihydrofolate reductase